MTREEAIEVYHGLLNQKIKEAFEVFAPELKESEDERIRKKIIRIIQVGGYMSPEEKDKAFVWLEKQGNLMKALQISNARIGELIEENYYLKEQLEKQKEQKPAEWSEDDSIKSGILSEIIFDYAFHKDALDENQDLTDEYAELDNWLESLPERFSLQPKNEWSEEDEENLNMVLDMVKYCSIVPPEDVPSSTGHLHPSEKYKKELTEWLKSLRPQPKVEWSVEEKPTIVETIKEFVEKGERCMQQAVEDQNPGNYTFWDGFHNCAENILREVEEPTEGIKGNLEEIPSNVDLEKAAEEYADKHGFRVPYDGSNNFYDDVDVKASLEGFKAGAKWMAEQIKGGSK